MAAKIIDGKGARGSPGNVDAAVDLVGGQRAGQRFEGKDLAGARLVTAPGSIGLTAVNLDAALSVRDQDAFAQRWDLLETIQLLGSIPVLGAWACHLDKQRGGFPRRLE